MIIEQNSLSKIYIKYDVSSYQGYCTITMVSDLQTAEGIYQNLFQGRFTNFHPFGTDHLENNGVQCRNRGHRFYSSFQICDIFSELINNRNALF